MSERRPMLLLCAALLAVLCFCSGSCVGQPSLPPLPPSAVAVSSQSAAPSRTLQLSATDRTALMEAANRAGYKWSEALSIVQTAHDRHIPLPLSASANTDSRQQQQAAVAALLQSTANCPPVDATCSFARACTHCLTDQSMARCLPCLALLECDNQPDCQRRHACKVCSNIDDTAADRPHACSQLASHCAPS